MYCDKCGTKNQDDSKFCFKCGTSLIELKLKKEQNKGITQRLGKMGVPGFRSGRKWKMALAIFGYFWIFLILLALIFPSPSSSPAPTTATPTPAPITVAPTSTIKPIEVAYIKKGLSSAEQWDSDPEPDGLKIRINVYSKQDKIIKDEGTLEVILFERTYDINFNPVKGEELDRWVVKVTKGDYGFMDLSKKLEYHNIIPKSVEFGWIDFTFIAMDGSKFQTYDDFVSLTI